MKASLSLRGAAAALVLLFPGGLTAQEETPDEIVLKNGDRLTGTIKTMAEGKLTLTTASMGDVEIAFGDIANLVSGAPLTLQTTAGETYQRQVTGIDGGALVLADPAAGPGGLSIALGDLGVINPPEKEQARWMGNIAIGANLTDGNTNRRSAIASADAERRTDQDRVSAKMTWVYSEEKDSPGNWNLTERRLSGEMQYDYFVSDKLYVLANTSGMGDTEANIDLRYTVGAGLGYQWIDEEDLTFSTEAGLSYFVENYRDNSPSQETVAARVAYSVRWDINDGVTFEQDVQAYPGLEQSDDIYVQKDSRLRFDLIEDMFAQLRWILDYDNTPAPGNDRTDNRFVVQAGWNF